MNRQRQLLTPVVAALLLVAGACSSSNEPQKAAAPAEQPKPAAAPAPESSTPKTYKVKFTTNKGPFIVEVHRDWAPLGADRFYELVKAGYYDGNRIFRVLPNFVAQFGLSQNPATTKKWDKPFKDDAILHTNSLGTLAFATAGPETRTTQVFVNLRSNQTLDGQGFAPFAQVTEGLEIVQHLYSGYGETPDQEMITKNGGAYLDAKFPKLDYIKTAKLM